MRRVGFIFILLFSTAYSQQWQFETVDSTVGPFYYSKLALDNQGRPHIFIFNGGNHHLIQYYKDETSWRSTDYQINFIPSGLAGNAEANFYLVGGNRMLLVSPDSTVLDTLPLNDQISIAADIALDTAGNPHIIAGEYDSGLVYHLHQVNSDWSIDSTFSFWPYLSEISMAIDDSDHMHFAAAWSYGPCNMLYADNSLFWRYTILAQNGAYGNVNLRLDPSQGPAILYNHISNYWFGQTLLEFKGSAWDTTNLDPAFESTDRVPLAFDGLGRIYTIVMGGGGPAPGDEATVLRFRSYGFWFSDTVFIGFNRPLGLEIDRQGALHLSYSTQSGRGLYYGRKEAISNIDETNAQYPRTVALSAHPNPFNAATTITVAGWEEAEIAIFDIAGRRVATLYAERGRAVWEARGMSSGVYFARAAGLRRSSGFSRASSIIKLILIK